MKLWGAAQATQETPVSTEILGNKDEEWKAAGASTSVWGLQVPEAIPKVARESQGGCPLVYGALGCLSLISEEQRECKELIDTPRAIGEMLATITGGKSGCSCGLAVFVLRS